MTRVLIVDDNEANLYLLDTLLRANQCEVVTARNGTEALALARVRAPDLAVSDVLMPGMDGFALCREWQRDPRLKRVPFVFYTATYTDPQDRELGLSLGAAAYLFKPEEPERLLEQLRGVLAAQRRGELPGPGDVAVPEDSFLAEYNRALVRKLEQRNVELDHALRELARDAEERKQHETRLREQARLLEIVQDAILVLDFEGVIRYGNHGAERVFGWSGADVIGRRFAEAAGLDAGRLRTALQTVRERCEWSGEMAVIARAGRPAVLDTRWTLVNDDAGRPAAALFLGTDVTEKKKLEAQFLQAQRLEAIGTLAAGIAHDINNILTPILLATPMLRWGQSQAEFDTLLSTIESSSQRAAQIIKQLLSFGRGQLGERSTLTLGHLVREVARIATGTFPKNIRFVTRVAPDLWPVEGDATQLHQVLLNLCINARDAMPQGGTLTIEAANQTLTGEDLPQWGQLKPGPVVCVAVADTGIGIPPEHLDRIFDPFFTTKEPGRGTGLGLATVQAIVRRHGGWVRVESQVGRGTRFQFLLPAVPEAACASGGTTEPASQAPAGEGQLLLVVDDEPSIRDLTQRTLEQHGYRVLTAADGAEALTLFSRERGRVRLVITDLSMPVLDGVLLTQALRRMDRAVPILVWSGASEADREAELSEFQVSRFLNKPVAGGDLLRIMAECLSGVVPPAPAGDPAR